MRLRKPLKYARRSFEESLRRMQTRVTVFVVLAFHYLPGVVDTLAGGVRGFPPRARVC